MPSPNQHVVRIATIDDLPALLDLYRQAGFGSGQAMTIEQARAMLARIQSYPDYRLYVVAQDGGQPLGTYVLLIMDNIAHDGRPLAIVEQVVVTRDQQRAGLGKLMMYHAMAEARKAGCYKLQLSSHTRFTNAHAFYDKLGFTRHGYSFYVDIT